MFRLWRVLLALALVAAATVGAIVYFNQDTNQDTNRDVELRYADRFKAIRQDFLAVAEMMPPTGQIRETSCPDVPASQLLFDYRDADPESVDIVGNTVVVTEKQLTNPASEPDTFDISPGSTLLELLERSDPAYQPTQWDDTSASDGYAKVVEAWSHMRYVVVTRTFDIKPGSATPTTFVGGSMKVEAVIADLRSHAILCTASAKADLSTEDLVYYVPESADGDTQRRRAQAAVDDALTGTAAELLGERLNSLGHGSFALG